MSEILSQYDHDVGLYVSFAKKVSELVREILKENGIHVHSVTFRVKDRASLEKKLSKPDSKYASLADVTDIAGIRITTYLEDDVDKIADLLQEEFKIDEANSIDKRTSLDPDRFGYLSLHHVVSLSSERCKFIEYRRFPGLKAEIQTRSILQHAWAEIEHDLGYKSSQEVPRAIRRRFSRLAGLLELADQEFISIKNELESYEEMVGAEIESAPETVPIDKLSLIAFVSNNELVRKLDAEIGSFCGAEIVRDDDVIASSVTRMHFLGFETIGELDSVLRTDANILLHFASSWLKEKHFESLYSGISLFYLGYVTLAAKGDGKVITHYLTEFSIGDEPETLTERIISTFENIRMGR